MPDYSQWLASHPDYELDPSGQFVRPKATAAAGTSGAVPYGETAANVNQFMTQQAMAPYLANLPNYANMVGQRTENIGQQLEGELPQDVLNQIMQQGAERGIMTGASGSSNANSAMLRALGLNSLQMQQQGSQGLSQAIADTPVPELWNPMSLYVPSVLGQQQQNSAIAGQQSAANIYAQQQQAANNSWNRPQGMQAFTMSNARWGM